MNSGGELAEVKRLRLKLKAAKSLIRDLAVAVAQCEEALERAHVNAQPPTEAQHHAQERSAAAA